MLAVSKQGCFPNLLDADCSGWSNLPLSWAYTDVGQRASQYLLRGGYISTDRKPMRGYCLHLLMVRSS